MAGRIFDRLEAHFGESSVVMDVDIMPFGEGFREYLHGEVARCDVLLAMMGPTDTDLPTFLSTLASRVGWSMNSNLDHFWAVRPI